MLGKYDLLRLEEPPYDPAIWDRLDKAQSGAGLKACAYPTVRASIAINKAFSEAAPKLVRFLDHYRMPDELVNKALVVMHEKRDRTGAEAARSFLRKYPEVWRDWVPAEIAKRVEASL